MKILALLCVFSSVFLGAKRAEARIMIEPIASYQSLHQASTSLSVSGLLVYGGRIVVGTSKLAVEAEYAQGSGSQSFTAPTETVKLTYQLFRLGLRTTRMLSQRFDLIIRGGAQDTKLKSVWDASGVVTTLGDRWYVRPYGGLGLEFYLSKKLSFLVESTYILNSTSNLKQNDFQTTFGINFHF